MLSGLDARAVPSASGHNWAGSQRHRALLQLILISSWQQGCGSLHVISEQQLGLYPHSRDGTPQKARGQAGKCCIACPVPLPLGKERSPIAANPFNRVNWNMWALARKSAEEHSTDSMHIQAYCFQRGHGEGRNLVKNKIAASQLH